MILHLWTFDTVKDYLTASALMIVGGILGIMFVTVLRRVMVEDRELPFPESVAASEIHKAGQRGSAAAAQLFQAMGVGAVDPAARRSFASSPRRTTSWSHVGEMGRSIVRLGFRSDDFAITGGRQLASSPRRR